MPDRGRRDRLPVAFWVAALALYLGATTMTAHQVENGSRGQLAALVALSLVLGLIRIPFGLRVLATLVAALIFVSVPLNVVDLRPEGGTGRGLAWVAFFFLPMLIGASIAWAAATIGSAED